MCLFLMAANVWSTEFVMQKERDHAVDIFVDLTFSILELSVTCSF